MPPMPKPKDSAKKPRQKRLQPLQPPRPVGEKEQFALLVATGMPPADAIRLVRPKDNVPKQQHLSSTWRRDCEARIEELRQAAARACELTHGITRASQIKWLLEVRDTALAGLDESSPLVQKMIIEETMKGDIVIRKTRIEVPSRLGANDQINKILGYYTAPPPALPAPGETEAGKDGEAKPGQMTLADFFKAHVRDGTAIANRKADVEAGLIIDVEVEMGDG